MLKASLSMSIISYISRILTIIAPLEGDLCNGSPEGFGYCLQVLFVDIFLKSVSLKKLPSLCDIDQFVVG